MRIPGESREQGRPATVRAQGSSPRDLPPKRYPWQRDVETVHSLAEDECFDRETFRGPADFRAKVTTCGHDFNLVHPNRGKEWQSPFQILQARAPALAGAVLNWRPLNLAQRHHAYLPAPYHRVHDLPSFPCHATGFVTNPHPDGSGNGSRRFALGPRQSKNAGQGFHP